MITIILGMHRSGTSTIAGVLHLNNISMGTYKNFWPRPLAQNPKGFYENYDFRQWWHWWLFWLSASSY